MRIFLCSELCLKSSIDEMKNKAKSEGRELTNEELCLITMEERELEIIKAIRLTGINKFNCTIDELKEKLKEKKNIILLSDDEVEDFNKAVKVMDFIKSLEPDKTNNKKDIKLRKIFEIKEEKKEVRNNHGRECFGSGLICMDCKSMCSEVRIQLCSEEYRKTRRNGDI